MPRLSAVDEDGDASPLHHRAPPPPLASNLEHVEAPVDPTSAFKHAALADFDEALASFASSEMFRMCDVGDPWTTNDMDLSASSGQTRVDSPVYGRLGECVETDDNNPLSLPHPPHPRYGHADSLVVPTDGKPWWSDPREGAAEVSLNATPSINPGLFTLTPAQRHQLQARQHNAYPPPRPPAPPARKRASRAADTPKRKRELGGQGLRRAEARDTDHEQVPRRDAPLQDGSVGGAHLGGWQAGEFFVMRVWAISVTTCFV